MNDLVNMDEVFALAIQIETNAAAFYRKAAGAQPDPGRAKLLEGLAVMEDGHKRTFEKMRAGMGASQKTSGGAALPMEGGYFLAAIMAGFPVEGAPAAGEMLTGRETMVEILRKAIDREKQSVLFYLGIKDTLSRQTDLTVIDRVLGEEKSHIVILTRELKKLAR